MDDDAPGLPLVLKLGEVCELLKVSPSTIRRMVKDGTFPAPLHNMHRWSRIAVYAWLARERRPRSKRKRRRKLAALLLSFGLGALFG
jgi:predicted DNA-binding transcriptional regulator AlpA